MSFNEMRHKKTQCMTTCYINQKLHEQSRPFKVYPLFEDKCALIFFLGFA